MAGVDRGLTVAYVQCLDALLPEARASSEDRPARHRAAAAALATPRELVTLLRRSCQEDNLRRAARRDARRVRSGVRWRPQGRARGSLDLATRALRTRSEDVLREALASLAAAYDGRDDRELMVALAPRHGCARRIGADSARSSTRSPLPRSRSLPRC